MAPTFDAGAESRSCPPVNQESRAPSLQTALHVELGSRCRFRVAPAVPICVDHRTVGSPSGGRGVIRRRRPIQPPRGSNGPLISRRARVAEPQRQQDNGPKNNCSNSPRRLCGGAETPLVMAPGRGRTPSHRLGAPRCCSATNSVTCVRLVAARAIRNPVQDCVLHTVMHEHMLVIAARLSDEALLTRMKVLSGQSREVTVELIAHLVEVARRGIHRAEGPGKLFGYLTGVLRFSEAAAWNRIQAARAVRRFPVVLDLLADGSVNLTTIRLLGPHLTKDNHRSLLAEAIGKGKSDIKKMVARVSPRPDVPATIRKLPAPAAHGEAPQSSMPLHGPVEAKPDGRASSRDRSHGARVSNRAAPTGRRAAVARALSAPAHSG